LAATLRLSGGYSTTFFVLSVFVCLGLIVYFYLNHVKSLPGWCFATLLSTRVVVVILLLLFIFQPEMSCEERLFRSAPKLLVLVDASQSMGYTDAGTGQRLEVARTNLLQGGVLRALEDQFSVRLLQFGASAQPIRESGLRRLQADQEQTDLGTSCKAAVARHGGESIAGILLLTDGIDNSGRRPLDEIKPLGVPVYAVGLGSRIEEEKGFKNVAIVGVESDAFVPKDNTTEIKVLVEAQGYGARPARVVLRDTKKDKELASQDLVLDTKKGAQPVVLKFTPTEIGRIDGAVEIPKLENEARESDNRKAVTINVTGPRIKVLYIEGVLRAEGKWLMRTLQTDPNVDLLYLVKSHEGQFLQRGNIKGITLNNIPTNLETWKRFDVIILGDVHSSLFTRNQLLDLKEAVLDGRGLLLLGGVAALGPGKYAGTPLEEIAPVWFGSPTGGQKNEEFSWELTDDGQVDPIFTGIARFFAARGGMAESPMQKLAGCTSVGAPKPIASVLAVHPTEKGPDGKPLTVVAAMNAGTGRSMVVTADTTHRWYLPNRALGRENPYVKLWGQTIRWLASEEVKRDDKPGIAAYTDKGEYDPGEKVRLFAIVRDPQGQATGEAKVTVSVIGPYGERTTDELRKIDTRLGEYDLIFQPSPGQHEAIFEAKLGGERLGAPQSVKFIVAKPEVEMAELSLNETLLKEIADGTGGTYCSWLGLKELATKLTAAQVSRTEPTRFRLYQSEAFFVGFILLAALEWFMRKRIQLA
jgi:hypothetical protein